MSYATFAGEARAILEAVNSKAPASRKWAKQQARKWCKRFDAFRAARMKEMGLNEGES